VRSLSQELVQGQPELLRVSQFALPDNLLFPPQRAQLARDFLVPLSVPFNLVDPVCAIVNWHTIATRTSMAVPKASMDKDYLVFLREDQVRLTWKILPMKPKAETESMDH
jgi:hypothetical protein